MRPCTKQGEHGKLHLYEVAYKDAGRGPGYEGVWRVYAYDAEHALDEFYEGPDSHDWAPSKPRRSKRCE